MDFERFASPLHHRHPSSPLASLQPDLALVPTKKLVAVEQAKAVHPESRSPATSVSSAAAAKKAVVVVQVVKVREQEQGRGILRM